MIISILAAAVLGVAAVAGETAREAKTRSHHRPASTRS